MKPYLLPLLLLCLTSPLSAQKIVRLASPGGGVAFECRLTPNAPVYRVMLGKATVVDWSRLTLTFRESGLFGPGLTIGKPTLQDVDETYNLLIGKAKTVRNHCQEITLPLIEQGASSAHRRVNLVVRAYDDGLAFRYEFPEQAGWNAFTLTDERTEFRLAGNPTIHTLFRPNFITSHEGYYTTLLLNAVKPDTLLDVPTLAEWPGPESSGQPKSGKSLADNSLQPTFVGITEAALVDYAGMYLARRDGVLTSVLSPRPGEGGALVVAKLPHRSPWRVILLGHRVGTLMESNILTSLNEPTKLTDTAWIRPGTTTFPWWNGNVTPDTSFAPGNNFETQKYCIDFCADQHIAYHTVVEYGLHEWYVSDGTNFQPGPNTDAARAVPGLDMQQVCDYGRQRGVGIRVWVHSGALVGRVEETFAQYERWGLSGLMVDFMDRDDQEMIRWQEMVLQTAARHKLHIQFHGVQKPTGLHRTYPNEFTREGVLNYENNKWNDLITPDHDLTIPFTRGLAGPTDYHLGGFRAVPTGQFKAQYTRPLMLGTRCHQLAMYVVLENYLPMVADYPDAYRGQPGFDWLQTLPATWDDTRVPAAGVNQFVCIARRSGPDWYVGTVTNHAARTVSIPLDFLPPGLFTADIYADAPGADQRPNALVRRTQPVTCTDTLTATLAAGGGQVMHLRPATK
jgi:alpha-glucosidase